MATEGTERRDEHRTNDDHRDKVARLLPERADKAAVLATRISEALVDGEPVDREDIRDMRMCLDELVLGLDRVESLQEEREVEADVETGEPELAD